MLRRVQERYDYIVVGGGIAGASAGYALAAHGSVLVLERESTCGQHSTGRSAALFTECYGDSVVRRLAIASRRFLEDPPDGFAATPILSPRSVMFIATERQLPTLDAATADFQHYVPSVRRVEKREAMSLCGVVRDEHLAGALLEPGAMDIDVHTLHQGFLRGIRGRGGQVRTSSPVTAIDRGERWVVSTPEATFAGDVIVNAAGAWCDQVAMLAGVDPVGLTPMRRTAFTFAGPGGHEAWPMVVDIDEDFYFKPEGPHILASPTDETPMEPCDVRHEEIDVAIGIERIQAATTLEIRHVKHAWAGLRSFVADRRPVVGEDPGHPGFYWLAGQGGFGIKTSPAMGRTLAALVVDGELPADVADLGVDAADLGRARLKSR